MNIGVPRERGSGERRVALTPSAVGTLAGDDHRLLVETGAGADAGFDDDAYLRAGAEVVPDAAAASRADLVLRVGPPKLEEIDAVPAGVALAGFLAPLTDAALLRRIADRGLTAFAMEAIPRTTLAQSMDALSSQATAAGYAAVLLAAATTPRIFPMLTTAAGTVSPVKVLVLGAGVAGLQAIATSRRLGAVVSGYDIRPTAKEEVESIGARFIGGPVEETAAEKTGYAREVAEDTRARQVEALAPHVARADVVITTAQVPGRRAPLLVTEEMVAAMEPGSVVVDVAAADGGNCALTKPGERVESGGVIVLGPLDLPSRVARDASQLYARNLLALLGRLVQDGTIVANLDDPILGVCCIVHEGTVVHPDARALLGMETEET